MFELAWLAKPSDDVVDKLEDDDDDEEEEEEEEEEELADDAGP